MNKLHIGMIGTDTSHSVAFAKFIHDSNQPYYVPGGMIRSAFAGGSPDFPLSIGRVDQFRQQLIEQHGVVFRDNPETVVAECDAVLLLSADGRLHRELFESIVSYGKPVFIDKPLALTSSDVEEIRKLADHWKTPVMSCSSLRYAQDVIAALGSQGRSEISSAEVSGPFAVEPTQSVYFWYVIHSAELLYAIMGEGCERVRVSVEEDCERIIGYWADGRTGTVLCEADVSASFGATLLRNGDRATATIGQHPKPIYADLMERVMAFFRTGQSPVAWSETAEIIAFLEAAEVSRSTGGAVIPLR